jgi:hypothetical protein
MASQGIAEQVADSPQARQAEMARRVWSAGDFARVGARLVLVGELLARSVDVHAGERVLGAGNAAISAARRSAQVTASDIVESLLETARTRAEVEGLSLATTVADAQALPFEDGAFDVVLSTFGLMFAPTSSARPTSCCACAGPGRSRVLRMRLSSRAKSVIAQITHRGIQVQAYSCEQDGWLSRAGIRLLATRD